MRSVTARNFVGGFLGGVIGILASWFISPLALPPGVLLGVLIGWYHADIAEIFRKADQQAKTAASGLVGAVDYVVEIFARFAGIPPKIARVLHWISAQAIVGGIVAIITAPARFLRWLAEDPMNRAALVSIASFLLFSFGVPVLMWHILPSPQVGTWLKMGGDKFALVLLSMLAATFGAFISTICLEELEGGSDLGKLRMFYRQWEIVSRYGTLGLFLYQLAMDVRYTTSSLLYIVIAGGWFMGGAALGFIASYPLIAMIGIAQGLWQLANRTGHLLCLGVTLAVTCLSWLLYHERFADPLVMGIVSLATGIISGVVIELVRRVLLLFYTNTRLGRVLANSERSWGLVFDDDGFMGNVMIKFGGLWFRHNRPARILRALCFSTPVLQPVRIIQPPQIR
jgi:hypothetical protein